MLRFACVTMSGSFRITLTVVFYAFLQEEAGAAAVRLEAQGNWALPHRYFGEEVVPRSWML